MAAMVKKIVCLAVILALSAGLIGCGKKSADLSPEREDYIRSLTQMGVYQEVYSKYGLEPGVTTDKIKASESNPDQGYYRMTFHTEGSYTVQTESGEYYSGTFKVDGYIESHGAGTDSCEITVPKNGSKTLPEHSIVQETGSPVADTANAGSAETAIYQPLSDFIIGNITTMGTVIVPPVECDINKDGYPELCTTVMTGSGIINSLIVVYDVQNDRGYMLNDRMEYDYSILGNTEDDIAVLRQVYMGTAKSYGTLAIEGDELIFVDNEEYGATVPAST